MNDRLPIVGVMGASDNHLRRIKQSHPTIAEAALARARLLGAALARERLHLLTGGGGGIMRSVSEGFASVTDRTGKIVGVIPGPDARPGYPNEHVEIAIRTHLPGQDPLAETSRNHINILSSDIVIALSGGPGTFAEITLAKRYGRPLALFLQLDDRLGEETPVSLAEAGWTVISDLDGVMRWVIGAAGELVPNHGANP